MRPFIVALLRIALATLAVSAAAAACGNAYGEDGTAMGPEAGADGDANFSADAGGEEIARTDAADAAAEAFPPPCDPAFPLAQVDCNGGTRPSCAKSTTIFTSYPAGYDRTNDLVVCNGSPTPSCVQHCPFGCAQMPAGYADHCDDCNGRADGYYCGRDLRGLESLSADIAIECENGRSVRGAICGAGKCASTCPQPAGPRPSCCIP